MMKDEIQVLLTAFCQLWGLELQLFFDEYLTLRAKHLMDMPAVPIKDILVPHPMILLSGFEYRLLDLTPEFRKQDRDGLKILCAALDDRR